MTLTDSVQNLELLVERHLDEGVGSWIQDKLKTIIATSSTKELYMAYSLLGSKIPTGAQLEYTGGTGDFSKYLIAKNATVLEISRIYLLARVLEADPLFFEPKVANLIQVADTSELVTFLKYLVVLPKPENYLHVAVEALRTNIATVFDAISAHNPFPARFFNDQQWNQMYLKAAFMDRDLSAIVQVDDRANSELARIISDYAHERWAASRNVDPLFWRPVAPFLDAPLLSDMERLLSSEDPIENRAGALCCAGSDNPAAKIVLNDYPELRNAVEDGSLSWETLKK